MYLCLYIFICTYINVVILSLQNIFLYVCLCVNIMVMYVYISCTHHPTPSMKKNDVLL